MAKVPFSLLEKFRKSGAGEVIVIAIDAVGRKDTENEEGG